MDADSGTAAEDLGGAAPTARAPVVVLVGPTASGKSALGVALARRLGGEIISADSMQLYRGMDIGTAKITAQESRSVPHHLLDVLDVTQEASVASYQQMARRAIADIRSRGRTPLIVGGSGLYVRAAVDEIDFPPTDPDLRAALHRRLDSEGAHVLRQELAAADPTSAETVRDDRRLVRALEVVTLTGRSFASYMPRRIHHEPMTPVVQIGLRVPRELLHRRIAARVREMVDEGLEAEVADLDRAGLRSGRTASAAIGYQQMLAVRDGAVTRQEAVEDIIVATRRLARRQETWFRADPRISWIDVDEDTSTEQITEAALLHIRTDPPNRDGRR
ncbi:MAG: tRNA (adenosine(37)-N6)-dimethylallyltransferase MiaA [Nesterenkonia sp.]|nr:tRNA (adenosine(37)-N6)-dimethylallyltransferase MiaA [Nesterenkonia sp.]